MSHPSTSQLRIRRLILLLQSPLQSQRVFQRLALQYRRAQLMCLLISICLTETTCSIFALQGMVVHHPLVAMVALRPPHHRCCLYFLLSLLPLLPLRCSHLLYVPCRAVYQHQHRHRRRRQRQRRRHRVLLLALARRSACTTPLLRHRRHRRRHSRSICARAVVLIGCARHQFRRPLSSLRAVLSVDCPRPLLLLMLLMGFVQILQCGTAALV